MAGAFVRKYLDLYHRLRGLSKVDNEDPDACWLWTSTTRGRTGNYPMINVRVDGQHRQLAAHRVSLVAKEIMDNGGDWDLFGPLYELYSIAGFEADHSECNRPLCVNCSHLVWREKEEHRALTIQRRRMRNAALGVST